MSEKLTAEEREALRWAVEMAETTPLNSIGQAKQQRAVAVLDKLLSTDAVERRSERRDADVTRLADVCAEYFERNGTWPLWATERLVELLRSKP